MMDTKEAPFVKKNFDFIDTIRCISMIGIVFEHSAVFWQLRYNSSTDTFFQTGYMQVLKFATIAFFLISGFLISHKFTEYSTLDYLKNRYKNTIRPWAFWILVLLALNFIRRYIVSIRMHDKNILDNPLQVIGGEIRDIVFYSNYWFILNFLICITILLLFKKHLYKYKFGIFWGAISLIYSINLYKNWFVTEHSTAFFGFVVYLWLGVILNKNYEAVKKYLAEISYAKLLAVNLFFFTIACAETVYLIKLGSTDAFNTLRITNILYSFSMFALMLKIGSINKLQRWLKPKQTTFGIYLIHQILIFRLLPELFKGKTFFIENMSVLQAGAYSFVRFLIVYSLTFLIVNLLMKSSVKWMIGSRA